MDAPLGTRAVPMAPDCKASSTSTVGLPLESRISLALTLDTKKEFVMRFPHPLTFRFKPSGEDYRRNFLDGCHSEQYKFAWSTNWRDQEIPVLL